MKYLYKTDAENGIVEGESVEQVIHELVHSLPITRELLAEGAFLWVEPQNHDSRESRQSAIACRFESCSWVGPESEIHSHHEEAL